ncbi:MAG: hypothetical protein ACR2KV_05630, partial [Solirubrobacteraceae bacterium]
MSRLKGWGRRAGRGAGVGFAVLMLPASAAAAGWTPPMLLAHCALSTFPQVVFPSADPRTSAGPGAILWTGDPAACAGGGAPGAGVGIATIAPADVAGSPQPLPLAGGGRLGGLVTAAATGDGRIVMAAVLGAASGSSAGLTEGRAPGPFSRPLPIRADPARAATATSYLGDVALATVSARTGRVQLRIQRHGAAGLLGPFVLSQRTTPVTGLAVGLDYRGDALVVWAQDGLIYRRVLHASGRLEGAERVAPTPPAPHLQALISDDNRGIVAWSSDVTSGPTTTTSVYLDASNSGVHFGPPRLLERFRDPPGLRLSEGSIRLVRLASEGVMIAWTGMNGGRYIVRAASVSLFVRRPSSVISTGPGDAVLADLATGPHNEAVALWITAPRLAAGFDFRHASLLAARGIVAAPAIADFSGPEMIAGPAPIAAPRAAVDPATDDAVAVWEDLGADPGVAYATRRAALRPLGPGAGADTGHGGWPAAWWLLAIPGLAVAVLAGWGGGGRRGVLCTRDTANEKGKTETSV